MAKFKLLAFEVVMLPAALAACAGAPVDQVVKPEILFASGDVIRLQWNPQQTGESRVLGTVRAFCGGRNFDEVPSPQDASPSGPSRTKTWRCHLFPGSGAGGM
ncbi:hypothetical protein GCM10028796_41510 [Ramlibacter monticola]|uniref:Uncharacterized protein n=1 Tax=Ramlibacter monticola TaxID=1926872 RepID=A0A936Z4M2_9BURK|nr:hypothetical protein [Ramlibacter monticola]MBL0393565.1 hypothetical protein [Ramlibacter monticola]